MLALRERALARGRRRWVEGRPRLAGGVRAPRHRPAARRLPAALGAAGGRRHGRHLRWVNPHLELEVAAHLGPDAEIAGVSAAIELVDTTPVSTDPEEILGVNVYHRHVILGPVDRTRRDGAGITGRLLRDGEEIDRSDDPAAVTGEITAVVRSIGELLAHCGAAFAPGDVIITGSVFAPVPVGPGHYTAELPPLGALHVTLA